MSEKKLESGSDECSDEYWMSLALEQAKLAENIGEVPVGAVLVKDNKLIASGYNQVIKNNNPSSHAEIVTMTLAGSALNNYRLNDTTLYVTLEPCPMCAGALVHARVRRLVFGAYDPKTGAAGSIMNIVDNIQLNHRVKIAGGVLEDKCATILRNFFSKRR